MTPFIAFILLATTTITSATPFSLQHRPRSVASAPSGWTYVGCVAEPAGGARVLQMKIADTPTLSPSSCIASCSIAGFAFAGMEFGGECWCGNSVGTPLNVLSDGRCSTTCGGDVSYMCGAAYMMSLYAKSSQISPTASTYLGCFTDANARTLVTPSNPSSSTFMTPAACQASCTSSGFLYSGVEAGSECWCGSSLSNTATHDASGQLCSVACTGSSTTNCGGNWAIAVYGRTLIPTSTSWTSIGCYLDDGTVRTLAGPVSKDNSLTPAKCQAACVGYAYSGVEFGSTCYCSNTMARTIQRPTAECSTPCAGDSTQMCGGAYRMTMSKVSTA